MDSFEESVRRALHASYPPEHVDAGDFLAGVHRGARGRRTRRAAGSVAATVAVITAGGYVAMASGIFTEPSAPIAGRSTVVSSPGPGVPDGFSVTSQPVVGSPEALSSASLPAATAESTADTSVEGTAAPPQETVTTTQETVTTTEQTVTATDETVTATGAPVTTTGVTGAARALSLSATGSEHQWVLLAVPDPDCPEQRCAVVEVTENAGKSWEPLSAIDIPTSTRPDDDTVREVRFAGDGTNGWAFGGDLLSTHDAGASWTTPTLPAPGIVTSLEAWGDFVYAVVIDDEKGSVALVRSPVGYDDWQRVDLGTDPYSISSLVVSQRVVALLARPMNSDVGNLVLVSSDGVSWTAQQPCTGGQYPSTLSTTGNSLWTMCSDDTSAVARVSLDDGQTWIDAAGEFPPGSELAARDDTTAVVADPAGDSLTLIGVDQAPVAVTDADLTDVDLAGFTNPTTGYVLDADGQVLRTDDGGRTWQPYSLPR